MTTVGEAVAGQTNQMSAALEAGLEQVSGGQTVVFTKYVKFVLPIDGSVFWIKADVASPSAVLNASRLNAYALGTGPSVAVSAPTITVRCDLHYSSTDRQDENASITVNRVVVTTRKLVKELNDVGPWVMYVGVIDGLRFAFSQRGFLQREAGLYHYSGDAVYSDTATQLLDSPVGFDFENVVVSNSLPIWLGMNDYVPRVYEAFGNSIPLFPSFLVPDNMAPPFASVHIAPEGTIALTAAPTLGPTYSHDQLCRDRVRVTVYGTRNFTALTFLDFVDQFSLNVGSIGVMNVPVVRDEKRTQVELSAIAQKKTIEFEVSYYQSVARDAARQLIEAAFVEVFPQPAPSPRPTGAAGLNFTLASNSVYLPLMVGV